MINFQFVKERHVIINTLEKTGSTLLTNILSDITSIKEITLGDLLSVRRGDSVHIVTVLVLTDKRGPATIAQTLYEETEQSKLERAIVIEKKKIIRAGYSSSKSKPSKKERRKIAELRMKEDNYN